jgi:nucleotide-binding universal stress UspA family protein
VSTILIGVDASAASEDAVALGRRLALTGAGKVVTATVTPSAHPDRDQAHATVRRMSGLLAGIEPERIRTAVVAGRSPAEALHRLVETEHPSVIVVGSSHRGRLGRVQPGGTGERLLFGSPCAVALAPDGYRSQAAKPVTRVAVAFDGSPESRTAFAAALAAARAYGAELEIVTVIPSYVFGSPGFAGAPGSELVRADVEASLRSDHEAALTDLPDGVRAESMVLEGTPALALAERSADVDLLFVGSRGYGPVRAVIAGGTSGTVLREAHCPVIVLPRGVEAPLADIFDDTTVAAGGPSTER